MTLPTTRRVQRLMQGMMQMEQALGLRLTPIRRKTQLLKTVFHASQMLLVSKPLRLEGAMQRQVFVFDNIS